jgi:hypothetical protein
MRIHELVARRKIEPDLEQLEGILRAGVEQWEHLRVHDAAARGEPLHVAMAVARGRAQRIGVIDEAAPDHGDGLEAAVWMRREARHYLPVVHAPTVLGVEVLAQVTTRQ